MEKACSIKAPGGGRTCGPFDVKLAVNDSPYDRKGEEEKKLGELSLEHDPEQASIRATLKIFKKALVEEWRLEEKRMLDQEFSYRVTVTPMLPLNDPTGKREDQARKTQGSPRVHLSELFCPPQKSAIFIGNKTLKCSNP